MKIGIFGLTADPCTCAHYEIVKKVLKDGLVDRVVVMPTIVGYYRTDKQRLFTNEERLKILHRWFDGMENVEIDDYEYRMLHKSPGACVNRRYIDMLIDWDSRQQKPRYDKYYTIIGGDSFKNFKTWYQWQDIIKMSDLIVVSRGDDGLDDYNGPIAIKKCFIDKAFSHISASKIREELIEEVSEMSKGPMGPDVTYLSLYLETVDEYLRKDRESKSKDIFNVDFPGLKDKIDSFIDREKKKVKLNLGEEVERRLKKIQDVLMDGYKDDMTKYSIIEDIVEGKV